MSADSIAASVTKAQWQHYLDQFGGLEESLVASVNDTSLVDAAKKDAVTQTAVGQGVINRNVDRYAMNVSGADKTRMDRNRAFGTAASNAQGVNTARIDQRERNLNVGASAMQLGRGVASTAINGLGEAASLEASRKSFNAQAKAQSQAQMVSTGLGLAGLAAAVFF